MSKPANTPSGAETHGFLGEEFLTWLWFRWETDGGEFQLPGGRVVGLALDDLLTFAAPDDETEQTLRHGLPTRTEEARTGLRQGRRLRKARLLLAEGPRTWSVTLDGQEMLLLGAKLPDDDPEAADAAERSRERAANFLLLHELVGGIYEQFLRVRLCDGYLGTDAEAQASWMQHV